MEQVPDETSDPTTMSERLSMLPAGCVMVFVLVGVPAGFLYYGFTATTEVDRYVGFGFAAPWFVMAIGYAIRGWIEHRRGWGVRLAVKNEDPCYLERIDGRWRRLPLYTSQVAGPEPPSDAEWNRATPSWAHGRRDLIHQRMRSPAFIGVEVSEAAGSCPSCEMIQVVRHWYPTSHDRELGSEAATTEEQHCSGCGHRWLTACE